MGRIVWLNLFAPTLTLSLIIARIGFSIPPNDSHSEWTYLRSVCLESFERDPDNSEALCEKALEFALHKGTELEIIEALGDLATVHHHAGRKKDALALYLRKIDRLHKLNDDKRNDDMARTMLLAAGLYEELDNQKTALSLLDEASMVGAGGAYQGDITAAKAEYWRKRGDFKKAEENYLLAVDHCRGSIGCKVGVLIKYAQMLEGTNREAEAKKIQTKIGEYLTEVEALGRNDENSLAP